VLTVQTRLTLVSVLVLLGVAFGPVTTAMARSVQMDYIDDIADRQQLTDIEFADARVGWIVGESGLILRSVDGGKNWVAQASGTSAMLSAIWVFDSQTAVIVGGDQSSDRSFALRTVDGGQTWTKTLDVEPATFLWDVCFVNSSVGWASGNGAMAKTTDGGRTWSINAESGSSHTSIHFFDASDGLRTDGDALSATEDGGTTWDEDIYLPGAEWSDVWDLEFIGATEGWGAGTYGDGPSVGRIWHTTDRGRTWEVQCDLAGTELKDVEFVDADNGWAVGVGPDGEGVVIRTGDGGATWTDAGKPTVVGDSWGTYQLTCVYPFDDATAIAAGTSGALVHAKPLISEPMAIWTQSPVVTQAFGANCWLTAAVTRPDGAWKRGITVVFEKWNGTGWAPLGTAVTGDMGWASLQLRGMKSSAKWRARSIADAGHQSVASPSRTVKVKARMSRTSSWGTLRRRKTYYARGYIEPRHYSTSGRIVIKAYKRKTSGKYPASPSKTFSSGSSYTYVSTTKTAYKVPVKFSATMKGTWKLVAYHAEDSSNAATYGSTDYVTVK